MRSLNARLTLSAGLVLAVFVGASAFALERAFRDSARSSREERLLGQVYLLMAAADVDARGKLTLSSGPLDPGFDLPGSGLYGAIVDDTGKPVWRSRSALSVDAPYASQLAAGSRHFEQLDTGPGYFLQGFGVSWSTTGGNFPFTFSVAEDLKGYHEQLSLYRRSLWSWLGAMAVLLLFAQWLTLRWGLSPLRRVADELTRLEQGGQDRIGGTYPTEVERLTDNLNTLLVHERARQKRYREALADLAHSLKTPLAIVRSALGRAHAEPELAQTLEEQVDRMDRIVGYHLQRAAASGRSGMLAPLSLRPAVERVVKALSKVYADKGMAVEVAIDERLRFRGDEGDLTEILGNVLDNAFKWGHRAVRASAQLAGDRLALTIEDDGTGIAEADAQRVLQRGIRADQSTPGHGIGLAVTCDIVEAYDGRVVIARSPLGGAAVMLELPGIG